MSDQPFTAGLSHSIQVVRTDMTNYIFTTVHAVISGFIRRRSRSMRLYRVNSFGVRDGLQMTEESAPREPAGRQVLVKVRASSLNWNSPQTGYDARPPSSKTVG